MAMKTMVKKVLETILPKGIIRLYRTKKFFFEVHLADHCNLNCVGCSHFSPVADQTFLDATGYEKDCKRFAELARKYVHTIHLMGGEPLLHSEISKIIRITRSNFNDSVIEVVTNGMLLDRMDSDFWKACRTSNAVIRITLYPVNINMKKVFELAVEHGVMVKSYGDKIVMNFRKDVYDIDGMQKNKSSYKKCEKKTCHHLYEGKFYMCPSPAYIKYINKYFGKDFKVVEKDYIDIYKIKDIRPILKYINKPVPFCRYCNIEGNESNVWAVSKKDASEWT